MKITAILIKKSDLNLNATKKLNIPDIKNYIDYKLTPYKSIGIFSYNSYPKSLSYIDGYLSPGLLASEILNWSQIRSSHINNYRDSPLLSKNFPNTLSNYFRLLSGEFLYENQFFNCQSNSSILSDAEIRNIQNNPSDYVLFFTTLHR